MRRFRRKSKKNVIDSSLPLLEQLRLIDDRKKKKRKSPKRILDTKKVVAISSENLHWITRDWCKEVVNNGEYFKLLNVLMLLATGMNIEQVMQVLKQPEETIILAIDIL